MDLVHASYAKRRQWHQPSPTRHPFHPRVPWYNGGWVCVYARATPPKPVKIRHRRPRLSSIQNKTRNRILEPKHGCRNPNHMGGARGGAPPHHCGSQASGPSALFDRPNKGNRVQFPHKHCTRACLRLHGWHNTSLEILTITTSLTSSTSVALPALGGSPLVPPYAVQFAITQPGLSGP